MHRTFFVSLAAAVCISGTAFAQSCRDKDDGKSRVSAQLTVPQVQLRARFWRELQRYAIKNTFQYYEWIYGVGEYKGRTVVNLLKHFQVANSVHIALVSTDRSDTFDILLLTCNLDPDQDWHPYWRDFQAFANERHYQLIESTGSP